MLENTAARITARFVKHRLEEDDTPLRDHYQAGGMVTAEIDHILAEDLCQDLIAPIEEQYEDEKARIENRK